MTKEEFKKILQRYETGVADDKERELIESWYDARYNDLILKGEKSIENPAETKARVLSAIEDSLDSFSIISRRRRYRIWAVASVAAIAAVGIFFFVPNFTFRKDAEFAENSTDKKIEGAVINTTSSPLWVQLEDGTAVTLDPQSKLTDIDFSKAERTVHLEGKAFFNVARNPKRPFYIVTENIVTRVLGTSFTVHAPKGKEETVAVKTGRVAVYRKEEKARISLPDFYVTVTPNHQVHFDHKRQKLVAEIVEHPALIPAAEHEENIGAASPQAPIRMEFDGTPVEKIFKKLEAAYGISIKYDAKKIANCSLTITLVDEDLFTRLQAVCDAIGGSYHVAGTEILVKNAGCNSKY